MSSRKVKLGDFLFRSKIPVDIEDNKQYKRVTIRTKHQGVSVRDVETGSKIGTKKQFILKAGQFVLSKIDAMYGAFGIAPDEVDGAIITGNFWAYDYDKKMVSIEWLNHFTNSPDFYELCRRASTGITHRKYLDEDYFLSYEVNLPDLNEQENLVFSIDAIRDKVSYLQNELSYQLTQLENLNQAILQEAVQGKLVPQDPKDEPATELLKRIKAEKAKSGKKEKPFPPIKPSDIPFEIPESWGWCRLGEIADIVRGGSPRPAGDKTYYDGDIPFLKVADLTAGNEVYLYEHTYTIKEAGLYKTRFVEANTLMLTNSGATLGYPKICTFPTTFNDGIAAFLNLSEEFDKVYLFYFLKSLTSWFLKVASRGQGQPNLNTDIIGLTLFPIPPKEEQKRIVAEIENQFAKTKQLKEHIIANQQATEKLLKALLHQAFEVSN